MYVDMVYQLHCMRHDFALICKCIKGAQREERNLVGNKVMSKKTHNLKFAPSPICYYQLTINKLQINGSLFIIH